MSGLIWLSTPVVNRSYGIPLRKSIVNQPRARVRVRARVSVEGETEGRRRVSVEGETEGCKG